MRGAGEALERPGRAIRPFDRGEPNPDRSAPNTPSSRLADQGNQPCLLGPAPRNTPVLLTAPSASARLTGPAPAR